MSLACSSTHKKTVCDKCDAGTSCTECCTCQPRRPKKASAEQETPHRLHPERCATCTSRFAAEPASKLDTMNEGTSNYASSQVHICQVLKLIGCDEHINSVQTLPSWQVEWASDKEIDHASMTRIQNVIYKLMPSTVQGLTFL